jgi:uncharacterized protein YbjT (DUF2867 family)
MSKIIAITGATGAQGGSLARAILSDPQSHFKVRAITRNPKSENAMKLVEMGAEVVQADLDDVNSLRCAFEGAYGVFCLTNFWEHFSPEKEIEQAGNMAQAAKDAGAHHVVWSTFNDTRNWVPLDDDRMPTLQGKYKVPHLDSKGEANGKFAALGVPTTYLLTSFYWENMIYFGMGLQRGPDGVLGLTLPMGDKKLPGMASEDIGKCAYGIFKKGDSYIGKSVGIAGEHLTGYEMASALTKAVGQNVRYNEVTPDVYRGFGFPGADDLGNMFQFKRDFNEVYCGERNLDESRALNPELQTFEKWLNVNASKLAIPE